MKIPWRLFAVTSVLATFCASTSAHSRRRGPLDAAFLVEEPVIHTPSHRVHAFSHFDITFKADGRRIKLVLEPNHDILPSSASVQYLDAEGHVHRSEPINREQHLVYRGSTWSQNVDGSWTRSGNSRITVERAGAKPLFAGMFTYERQQHHIQLGVNWEKTKHAQDPLLDHDPKESMVVYRDADVRREGANDELKRSLGSGSSCNSHNLGFNSDPNHAIWQDARGTTPWGRMSLDNLFGKRQIDGGNGYPGSGNGGVVNLRDSIGQTDGCPSTRRVALVGVATDCTYTAAFDSEEDVRQNIITQINAASDVYERTFNISLGLQNITLSNATCPTTAPDQAPWNIGCSGSTTITDRLNLFSAWRSRWDDTNAYWTLLTTCNTNEEVGLAWLGQLCVTELNSQGSDSTSGANVVARTSEEWQVIAHEAGHTFGAVHDCDSSLCAQSDAVAASMCCPRSSSSCDANGQFIMNPSTGDGISEFSPCTVGNICSAFLRRSVRSDCLSENRNVQTYQGNQCGNGIVEAGEDCDCGDAAGCADNNCCDPSTCQFRSNAVCDDSNDDCCSNCQFSSAGVVCRPSTGECDPEETCSGTSATCPTDDTAPDGQECAGEDQQCASGQCTSRNLQCRTLMGSYTQNNDTYACNQDDCTISCASPEFGPNSCYSMTQNFLDGTPCGGGGRCSNGRCAGSTVGGQIGSWINSNRPLVIGICSGVGGLIIICILLCCISRCRRRKQPKRARTRSSQMAQTQPLWTGYPQQNQGYPPSQDWNANRGWSGQQQQQQHWQGQGYGNYGHGSVRYA